METNTMKMQKEYNARFKSYYVVWKLESGITKEEKRESLNRTM